MHKLHRLSIAVIILSLAPAGAVSAPVAEMSTSLEQEFIITAYYSPKPDQCCYVKGTLAADAVLNGEGIQGADGTNVYPGMAAAPRSYPFGTRVQLPGIGVVTVHDRGGAIQELSSGKHRLDIWMGSGEEGLARALAFGVQHVRGTVYPPGIEKPPEELSLSRFASPVSMLRSFLAREPDLLALRPRLGDTGLSVQVLQEHLRQAGYFDGESTGTFGPLTQRSLQHFLEDMDLEQPSDALTESAAAYLVAALERLRAGDPLSEIHLSSTATSIAQAQRILRFLGYYRGRTDGEYTDRLESAILAFQKAEGIVRSAQDPGAGIIGPQTRLRVVQRWNRELIAARAETLLDLRRIDQLIQERRETVAAFLSQGDRGEQVRILQRFLADHGFFAADRITGTFGEETRKALIAYQLRASIVSAETEKGAGMVGPATLAHLHADRRSELYRLVRAEGWHVL